MNMMRTCMLAGLGVAVASNASAQQPPPVELDTVHVRAASRLPDVGFRSIEVVDRAQLDRLPAPTVAAVLARVLGVDVLPRSAAQADLSIRGSTFEQVLVLVDGVRVSDEQTGHFNLDLAVPVGMIERIEVLRGPGSAVYGSDAVGGVVNIVTRRDAHLVANVRAGTFGSAGAGASYGLVAPLPGFAIQVAADYARSDGHRPGTDYDTYQARVAAAQMLGSSRLALDLGIGVRDFGAADFYAPYLSHERTTTTTWLLRYEPAPLGRWQFTPQVSFRQHTDRFTLIRDDPSFYRNEHDSWQTGAELVAHHNAGGALAFVAGAEVFAAGLQSVALGDRLERRVAVFAEATFGSVDGVALNAGLRLDRGNAFDAFASPALGITVKAAAGLRLRASGTRGFRAPTWTERYYEDPANVGDPNLRPERFRAGEVGVRAQFGRGFDGDLAVFRRAATDLIDWARSADEPDATSWPWRTMNIARADFTGVEARLQLPDLAGAHIGLRAMALSVDAAAADGFISKYALRNVTQQLGLAVDVPVRPALTVGFDAAHARRAAEGSFLHADARASWSWDRLSIDIDLLNLTAADYLDASAKPVAGRSVSVGLRWGAAR